MRYVQSESLKTIGLSVRQDSNPRLPADPAWLRGEPAMEKDHTRIPPPAWVEERTKGLLVMVGRGSAQAEPVEVEVVTYRRAARACCSQAE
jgi:hypothetical protein